MCYIKNEFLSVMFFPFKKQKKTTNKPKSQKQLKKDNAIIWNTLFHLNLQNFINA